MRTSPGEPRFPRAAGTRPGRRTQDHWPL